MSQPTHNHQSQLTSSHTQPPSRSAAYRFIPVFIVAIVAILFWSWTYKGYDSVRREHVLETRGAVANAQVVSASYDPNGGDPNGWTTDQIAFVTSSGQTVHAVIGHHGPADELKTHKLSVLYDPLDTSNVRPAGKTTYYRTQAADNLSAGLTLSIVVTITTAVIAIYKIRRMKRS